MMISKILFTSQQTTVHKGIYEISFSRIYVFIYTLFTKVGNHRLKTYDYIW